MKEYYVEYITSCHHYLDLFPQERIRQVQEMVFMFLFDRFSTRIVLKTSFTTLCL